MRKEEERLLQRTEMGISLRENERNEDIRKWTGVRDISEKAREDHLRLLGHVLSRVHVRTNAGGYMPQIEV